MDEWCAEEENDSKAIYVNLVKNKESYTAYEGKQIWDAIYKENCMLDKMEAISASQWPPRFHQYACQYELYGLQAKHNLCKP